MSIVVAGAMALAVPFGIARPDAAPAGRSAGETEVENVRAFARLYGYVRFFHPSDEAAGLDWSRFAVHGAARVRAARSPDELAHALEALFRPMAPTVDVYREGAAPDRHSAGEGDGDGFTAWQHVGVDLAARGAPFWSYRLRRGGHDVLRRALTSIGRTLDARPYRGMEMRLRARVMAEVGGAWRNRGALAVRVTREDGSTAFEDHMRSRPILSPARRIYEITGPVAGDGTEIHLGARLVGTGAVRVDDVELSVRRPGGPWRPVPLVNAGFEEGTEAEPLRGWSPEAAGGTVEVERNATSEGSRVVRLSRMRDRNDDPLFEARPEAGEAIDASLGAGLRARVPLTLDVRDGRTVPGPGPGWSALRDELARIDPGDWSGDDPDVRLAAGVIAWNVLHHFYPYFEHTEVDWDAELTRVMAGALEARDAAAFHVTLREMIAELDDGHAFARWYAAPPRAYLPFLVDRVEGRIVVVVSDHPRVRVGDVVLAIDGVPVERGLREEERLVSGSPQWKRRWALTYELGSGEAGTNVEIELGDPAGRRTISVERVALEERPAPDRPSDFAELEPGIVYVDLTATPMTDIEARIDELTAADGIVFDVRGTPRGNHRVLEHLLAAPDTSDAWFRLPQRLYPDRERLVGYELHGWGLEPAEPRIEAEVAFLTDARAISYAEGFLSFVDHYGLGEIVGRPTAGANGNVNTLYLPGLYQVTFTGAVVVRHDGSPFHEAGIVPTVPAEPTIAGLRSGRDEVLETGISVVREADGGR